MHPTRRYTQCRTRQQGSTVIESTELPFIAINVKRFIFSPLPYVDRLTGGHRAIIQQYNYSNRNTFFNPTAGNVNSYILHAYKSQMLKCAVKTFTLCKNTYYIFKGLASIWITYFTYVFLFSHFAVHISLFNIFDIYGLLKTKKLQ